MTGKSYLAKEQATEAQATFFSVSCYNHMIKGSKSARQFPGWSCPIPQSKCQPIALAVIRRGAWECMAIPGRRRSASFLWIPTLPSKSPPLIHTLLMERGFFGLWWTVFWHHRFLQHVEHWRERACVAQQTTTVVGLLILVGPCFWLDQCTRHSDIDYEGNTFLAFPKDWKKHSS